MATDIPFIIFLLFISTSLFITFINVTKIRLMPEDDIDILELRLVREYGNYVRTYNKSYDNAEYLRRMKYFGESLKEVSRLNSLHGTHVFGVNVFSDWSPEEKNSLVSPNKKVGGCRQLRRPSCPLDRDTGRNVTAEYRYDGIPLKFDWRERGVIGNVLDQKLCNGCWAFSIVGVMESMWAISGHQFYSLSIQELIDCSTQNKRCDGGDISGALDFLCMSEYPIVKEGDYPLKLVNEPCRLAEQGRPYGRKIAEFTSDCNVDEDSILRQIAYHGPVVAAVNAIPWFYYTSGVIQRACNGQYWENVTHAIQIVGYDLTAEVPYYIVRNSWGVDFGENGYVRLAVYRNTCGIRSNVAYFTVK